MSYRKERAPRWRPGWRASRRRLLAITALAAFGALNAGGTADAVPMAPQDLRVEGEAGWRADSGFIIRWGNPNHRETPSTVVATRYRMWNSQGGIAVGEKRFESGGDALPVYVPGAPGVYMAEIWFEDRFGIQGPSGTVMLRFDNARPANVEPLPRAGWIGRTEQPFMVRIEPPKGTPPISGIRGYAVSVDRKPHANPCLGEERCSVSETDSRGGANDNAVAVGELPEGTSYVHAVAVSGSGMRSPLPGHTTLRVDKTDPTVRLTGVPSGWTNRSVPLFATAGDELSGMRSAGTTDGPFTAIRIDDQAPAIAAGDTVHATVIEPGIHTVSFYARDAAGNVNDGGHLNGHPNRPPSTATVRIDRESPHVAFLNSQDPEEPETIEAQVIDPLAGPSRTRGEIAVRPAGSDGPFEALPSMEVGAALRAHWSSDAFPAGVYEFRATAYDAAGNSSSTTMRADGSAMHLPNPLKVPTTLSAGFGGKTMVRHRCARREGRMRCRRETIGEMERRPIQHLIGHARGTHFSGRLVAGARAPLAQARVLIVERFDPGVSRQERVTPVSTNENGGFVIRLSPGPSREVMAVFEGGKALSRASSEPVRLDVRSGVRLRASAPTAAIGGRPVIFRGRILGGDTTLPVDGRTVQFQFRVPGVPWTEFRTVQTDARGGFRYPYRFSDDDSRGVRFQFRAFVPTQKGWPYSPAGSLPVTVRGL